MPLPRYYTSHDPHAGTRSIRYSRDPGSSPAASEGAWAPYATVVAERRPAALRFSDFWMALWVSMILPTATIC